MPGFLRSAKRHVFFALLTGLLLRLWFVWNYPVIDGDTLVYADIAHNWFRHGIYGITRPWGIQPTLIRLPGYPLFLALCSGIFGAGRWTPVLLVQTAMDLAACLLVASFAARALSRRAGIATLFLASLCPFTANYVASPLTETPTLFCIALGLYALLRYLEAPAAGRWFWLLAFSMGWCALLRPDGALLGVVLLPAMFLDARPQRAARKRAVLAGACAAVALLPFAVWTARNARTFHVFQPLAPRYANDPGEFTPRGWIRWVRTWCVEYTSTAEVYWSVSGDAIDPALLPARAWGNGAQAAETRALIAAYNRTETMTPALSHAFQKLAAERIAAHPWRYWVGLPLARLADMWLRPRTAQLWIELRWWQYSRHHAETIFSWVYAGVNLLYLLLALWGLRQRVPLRGVMLAYILLRCALLLTIEAPEDRYTLECFPMIFILAGAAIAARWPGRDAPARASASL
jgi:4-amino-4-deoxy-L-arabinose transferase-like glycosyltransferase